MARSSTTFQKGQSGNPKGRSKVLGEIQELARQYTDNALKTLVEICGDSKAPSAARVAAASAILDRGYGKPPQAIQASEEGTTLEGLIALSYRLQAAPKGKGNGASEGDTRH